MINENYPSTSTRSPQNSKRSNEEETGESRIGITPSSSPSVTDEEIVAVGQGNPRILRDPRGHMRTIPPHP